MHPSANRLPKKFPVGTTYVVEGHSGGNGDLRVSSRYVILPGGRRIDVAVDLGRAKPALPRRRNHQARNRDAGGASRERKKIVAQAGTVSQCRR